MNYIKYLTLVLVMSTSFFLQAQENTNQNPFRQLGQELPTPNVYRTGSGAPGHQYWQQKADYEMSITLDDDKQTITGKEVVTYYNQSPDPLTYLWVQLDQNMRALDSDTRKVMTNKKGENINAYNLKVINYDFDGGFKIEKVTYENGDPLSYKIVKTMMRLDLKEPLEPGDDITFNIDWWYNINNRMEIGGRSGYEYFPEDDNYLYTIAQFFPRMAVYIDNEGWQNKQFLGRGEFALVFGDYDVKITVPSDHLVSSTGTLQNEKAVLSPTMRERYARAQESYVDPVIIYTEEEAIENEKTKAKDQKTWHFKAENVRDFAFASSRKFIWDAMAVKQTDGTKVMAMSMYPKEGNPLWEQYSTKAVAHTLKWFSHYTFPYPYPVAWSIHAKSIGMEYPMICFNFGRPDKDGTYSERVKYGMIGVIIHEVGHNYFPMIVNSDERQWTWMDEGLNSFLQYLTEQQWERNYPSRRGPAYKIAPYMAGDKSNITPIMTNSESIYQFGNNAYGKPATALNILRESVLGRELFDYSFKIYANRWKFKHPAPADLFRTLEDASAVDLDWFWRAWFYTTDHVDIAITSVDAKQIDSQNPDVSKLEAKKQDPTDRYISNIRNAKEIEKTYVEQDEKLVDFYNKYDPYKTYPSDQKAYENYVENLSENERKLYDDLGQAYFYEITFENIGGIVMPLIIEFTYQDGTSEVRRIPAEIWKMNWKEVTKIFKTHKEVKSILLDPFLETADTDVSNNTFPKSKSQSRFDMFKDSQRDYRNTMQKYQNEVDQKSEEK